MNGVLHSEHVISRSGIAVSPREGKLRIRSLCSSERWRRVSFHHSCGTKALFSQTLRRKAGVPTVCCAECTPAIQIFLRNSTEIYRETVAEHLQPTASDVASSQHSRRSSLYFHTAYWLLINRRNMSQTPNKGPDI